MSKTPKIDRQREHQANERTFLAWLGLVLQALVLFYFYTEVNSAPIKHIKLYIDD